MPKSSLCSEVLLQSRLPPKESARPRRNPSRTLNSPTYSCQAVTPKTPSTRLRTKCMGQTNQLLPTRGCTSTAHLLLEPNGLELSVHLQDEKQQRFEAQVLRANAARVGKPPRILFIRTLKRLASDPQMRSFPKERPPSSAGLMLLPQPTYMRGSQYTNRGAILSR